MLAGWRAAPFPCRKFLVAQGLVASGAACQPALQSGTLAGTLPPASDPDEPLSLAVKQVGGRVGVGGRDLLAIRRERPAGPAGAPHSERQPSLRSGQVSVLLAAGSPRGTWRSRYPS